MKTRISLEYGEMLSMGWDFVYVQLFWSKYSSGANDLKYILYRLQIWITNIWQYCKFCVEEKQLWYGCMHFPMLTFDGIDPLAAPTVIVVLVLSMHFLSRRGLSLACYRALNLWQAVWWRWWQARHERWKAVSAVLNLAHLEREGIPWPWVRNCDLVTSVSKALTKVGEDKTTQKSLLRTPCLILCVVCEQYISQTTPMWKEIVVMTTLGSYMKRLSKFAIQFHFVFIAISTAKCCILSFLWQ